MIDNACFSRDPWLHIFRKNLRLKCSTLEYARKAISYNPCNDTSCSYDSGSTQSRLISDTHRECDDFTVHDVAHVFKLGDEALISVPDYRINLYKIYLVLTEAIRRIKSLEGSHDEYEVCKEYLSQLLLLLDKFSHYSTISAKLSNGSLTKAYNNSGAILVHKTHRPERYRDVTSKFKIDKSDLDIVLGRDADLDNESVENKNYKVPVISWSFFKHAKCKDIFALLCYALAIGSFDTFEVILTNSTSCIYKHIKDHWKVILSYLPISSDCKGCSLVFDSTFSLYQEPTNEDMSNAVDWFIWKSFLILNYTNSPFLLMRFVRNTFKIFEGVPRNKLQLVLFLKSMIRQYLIYKSSTADYQTVAEGDISFFAYIDMDAADKLQLFCELGNNTVLSNDCECGDFVKDKHGVYKFCLLCRMKGLSSKLKAFFTLVEPFDEYNQSNQFLSLDKKFSTYYSSLVKSMNSSLDNYIEKISGKFRGELDMNGFEILYSLTDALLQTEFRPRVYSLLIGIIYSKNTEFNLLEHYFIIRSIFSLVGSSARGVVFKDNCIADTHINKIFLTKLNGKSAITSHHNYRKLCSVLGSGNLDEVVPLAVSCQLDFLESLLNLLLLIEIEFLPIHLSITPLELTNALCDTNAMLHLLQKILVYIMDMLLPLQDFRNCIHELSNMSLHISNCDINTVYSLFFYTICVNSDNESFLEEHLNIWLDFCKGSLEQLIYFANSSIKCLYDTIYKLDAFSSSYCHLFHFVAKICNYTPKVYPGPDSVYKSINIGKIINIYLGIIGVDANCNILLDYKNLFSLIDKVSDITILTRDRNFMRMLEKLCMVQKIHEAFNVANSDLNLHYVKLPGLSYTSYDDREFIINSISSLANVTYEARYNYGENEVLTLTAFSSILSTVQRSLRLQSKALPTEDLENITSILCPRDIKRHIIFLVNAIGSLSYGDVPVAGEIYASPVSYLAVQLFTLIALRSEKLSYIATLLQHFKKDQLRKPLSFVQGNINACYDSIDSGPELQGCDIINLLKENNKSYKSEHTDNLVIPIEQQIFKTLSTVNISRVDVKHSEKVKVSLEKFANRISGNVASGFFSAALEKADGLYSITKVPKFESIKERFWNSAKREKKSCFLPILNFFDSTPLVHEFLDVDNPRIPDLLNWRYLEELDLLQLVSLDVDLASLTLMEICDFNFNSKFVTLVLRSLNTIDIFQNLKFLQSLMPHITHLGWPILEPLSSICNFLTVLSTIESDSPIVLGHFIRDSTYRRGIFSKKFVANNFDTVKYIYGILDYLYTFSSLELQIDNFYQTPFNEKDVIDIIFFDGKIRVSDEFKSADIFDEYVNVLIDSYEMLFLEQDESVYHLFYRLEPIFLFHSEAYLNCLLRIYENCQNMSNKFWLLWRYSVYKLLLIHPNTDAFDMLYMPRSLSIIQMLESIAKAVPDFELSAIDETFQEFKYLLMKKVNIDNYFYIANAMEGIDKSFSQAVYRNMELKLRPHSDDTFDSTRSLFEFDLSLATL